MIKTNGLAKSFKAVTAINDVSIQVDAGDIFGLVGPDGAGKTTLLRLICGLIDPDRGDISLAGYPIRNMDRVRDKLGYMPQRFSLYGDLTVMENIRFFAAMYNLPRATVAERADEILAITNMSAFKQRLADNLSGGMKQKLALTCALITRPRLLVLDEPTYGVDPQSRKEFWKILYGLNRDGMTVMVSTAYMDEAELCTRVAFINQGRVKIVDSPDGLRSSFAHHLLEVRANSRDPHLFTQVAGLLDVSFYGYKYQVMVDDVALATANIKARLQDKGLALLSLREVSPSMEEVFVLLAEKEAG
ncbi:MAG: ABC transporter ATP-binding protein [Syntrophomonadaceae bacterium]